MRRVSTTTPRFSIVVPVHDGAPWIGEAIASVRRQTRPDWELIVVDDGSSDATAELVARETEPRLRLLRQDNAGQLAARRRGLTEATGDLVVFLDADDRLRPDALDRFARGFARRPDALVAYGDRVLLDGRGSAFGPEHGALLAARPSGDVLERLLARNFISTPGQGCIRRAALDEGDAWPADLRRMADWYVWCRVASRGAFAYVGRGPVVEYRLHAASLSRRFVAGPASPPSIAELEPAIAAVFALPEVRRRFPPARLAGLRRRCEASAFAWKGQDLLRASRFRESRRYLLEALRRAPAVPVDVLCLVLTVLGLPPGVRRWVGTTS